MTIEMLLELKLDLMGDAYEALAVLQETWNGKQPAQGQPRAYSGIEAHFGSMQPGKASYTHGFSFDVKENCSVTSSNRAWRFSP